MLLGSTILATPGLGIYGSAQSVFWRFITGWMLLGIGTINLILVRGPGTQAEPTRQGMAVKGTIRKWRHQVRSANTSLAHRRRPRRTKRSRRKAGPRRAVVRSVRRLTCAVGQSEDGMDSRHPMLPRRASASEAAI